MEFKATATCWIAKRLANSILSNCTKWLKSVQKYLSWRRNSQILSKTDKAIHDCMTFDPLFYFTLSAQLNRKRTNWRSLNQFSSFQNNDKKEFEKKRKTYTSLNHRISRIVDAFLNNRKTSIWNLHNKVIIVSLSKLDHSSLKWHIFFFT